MYFKDFTLSISKFCVAYFDIYRIIFSGSTWAVKLLFRCPFSH